MAARGGSESKPGMIITLIFFVLMTIILGVTTYLGFSEQETLRAAKKKADDEKGRMEAEKNWQEFQAMLFRNYLGRPLASDKESFATYRESFDQGTLQSKATDKSKDAVVAMFKQMDEERKWNAQQKQPGLKIDDELKQLRKDLETRAAEVAKQQADLKTAGEDLDKAAEALKRERATYEMNLNAVKKKSTDDRMSDQAELEKMRKALDAQGEQIAKLNQQIADDATAAADKQKVLNKQIAALTLQLQKAQEALPENKKNESLVDLEYRPKGEVLSVEGSGAVMISLGSSDGVQPQFTFAVHGVDADGRWKADPKGTIEVVRVVGPRISQARVVSLRDSEGFLRDAQGRRQQDGGRVGRPMSSDPRMETILKGDKLFNAVWNQGLPHHVAIVGTIDPQGDGSDHIDEFRRNLARMGVIVDAYLDLKEREIKGEITKNTDYVIKGGEVVDDPRFRRDKEVVDELVKKEEEFMQKAKDNAVPVVTLRKYLAMSGYRLPPRTAAAPATRSY